ncbi:uncharacterized protein LOC120354534 [Nilaparvata lugens]|uniref:uncharacterized protein LOC120354534 n=1 Tax=Nilaparvata lugens TaxID=108931 RepID=UPI00193D664D|nr:uncharacterized protein LOC120354534 [Nilaparvata lugens]
MNCEIKKFKTQRGAIAIEIDGYKFRKDRAMANGRVSFRCLKIGCSMTLKTNAEMENVLETNRSHNHNDSVLNTTSQDGVNDVSIRERMSYAAVLSSPPSSSPMMRDMGVNTPNARTVSPGGEKVNRLERDKIERKFTDGCQ